MRAPRRVQVETRRPRRDTVLVDLYVALVTPAGIGMNILGKTWYDQYTAGRGIDDQIMLIAANGAYSFLGDEWEHGDVLERVEIVQGDKTIRLSGEADQDACRSCTRRSPPNSRSGRWFSSPARRARPRRARSRYELLVTGAAAGGRPGFATFSLPYHVPDAYVLPAAVDGGPSQTRRGRAPPRLLGRASTGGTSGAPTRSRSPSSARRCRY